jgi:Flp pilus assembly CpaE family ATPase
MPVEDTLQRSGVRFEAAPSLSGSVFSFLPADGASKAGAVAQQLSRTLAEGFGVVVLLADFAEHRSSLLPPIGVRSQMKATRRLDGHTWGALVWKTDGGNDVLDAREVQPHQLGRVLEHARHDYGIICADLTGAMPAQTLETLRVSDAIFLVASCDPASLAAVREKMDWLRSAGLDKNCCLLLRSQRRADDSSAVEEFTGLPVCSLLNNDQQIEQLAGWLASNASTHSGEPPRYALAG